MDSNNGEIIVFLIWHYTSRYCLIVCFEDISLPFLRIKHRDESFLDIESRRRVLLFVHTRCKLAFRVRSVI
jgi:hypothetical protein